MDDQALRDYFAFDEVDLAANRKGEFSEKQKQKIAQEYQDNTNAGLKTGLPTAVLAFILLLVNILFFKKLGSDAIATIVFMLVCGGLGFAGLRSAYKTRKIDFSKFGIEKVSGPVRIEFGNDGDCFVYIGNERFEVDEELAGSMKQGAIYTFYLESREKNIFSVEWNANE